jgi:hypothetical protein
VTRPKSNVPLRVLSERPVSDDDSQTAAIESDTVVELASQQRLRLPIALRRIVLRREDGRLLTMCAVRRRRFSSGCKSRPATAPAGSSRSRHGGDEMSEAFG